jgi:hypothetical protein
MSYVLCDVGRTTALMWVGVVSLVEIHLTERNLLPDFRSVLLFSQPLPTTLPAYPRHRENYWRSDIKHKSLSRVEWRETYSTSINHKTKQRRQLLFQSYRHKWRTKQTVSIWVAVELFNCWKKSLHNWGHKSDCVQKFFIYQLRKRIWTQSAQGVYTRLLGTG